MPYLSIFESAWFGLVETRFALPAKPDTLEYRYLVRRRSDATLLAIDVLVGAIPPLIAVAVAAFHFSPLARMPDAM
jgi:hypothetical protein